MTLHKCATAAVLRTAIADMAIKVWEKELFHCPCNLEQNSACNGYGIVADKGADRTSATSRIEYNKQGVRILTHEESVQNFASRRAPNKILDLAG